jgi:hypothetical protein
MLISVQARKSKRQQPSSEPPRRSKSKHRMRRRPPVPMSHPSPGLSPCRRGARSRAHDSGNAAGAFLPGRLRDGIQRGKRILGAGRRGEKSHFTARSPSPFEPKINQYLTKLVYLEIGHSGRVCWLLGQPLA